MLDILLKYKKISKEIHDEMKPHRIATCDKRHRDKFNLNYAWAR